MEVAVLGQDLENFAGLVLEEAVVRKHDRRTTALFQDRQDVLDKVELLVARRDREVVAVRRLVRALGSERRIREHQSKRVVAAGE